MKNSVKKLLSYLIMICMLGSFLPAVHAAENSDIYGHWAEKPMQSFIDSGYVVGFAPGEYRPDETMTRAQFASVINRFLALKKESDQINRYKDVNEGDWFYHDMAIALQAGYLSGTSADSISPNSHILREQACVMLARLLNIGETDYHSNLNEFKDMMSVSSYARASMAVLEAKGYLAGDNGFLAPKRPLTRAEAVALLYRMKDVLVGTKDKDTEKEKTQNLSKEKVIFSGGGSSEESGPNKPNVEKDVNKKHTIVYGKASTGYGYYVNLAVMLDENKKIIEIKDNGTKIKEDSVSPVLYNKSKVLFEKLKGFSLDDIKKLKVKVGGTSEEKTDAISGATYTCNAIKEAILNAYGEKTEYEAFVRNKKEPNVLEEYKGDDDIVIIPEDITVIDEYSFSGKENVKKIIFHKDVKYINPKAFDTCIGLKEFYVDKDNTEYYSENGIIYDKKINKKLCVFPCGRTGEYSVEGDVTEIGNKAFYSSQLSSLNIHENVKSLGEGFVDYANNLENISININNEKYSSEDGIVYNKDKTTILFVPPGIKGEHTLATNVQHIGEFAFYSCTKLTKINLQKNLSEISLGAFAGCGGLKSIELPSSLRIIGDRAFAGCVKLEDITLPEGLEEFGDFVFSDCINLQSIRVDALNPLFNSKKGVLFNAKGNILYAYPVGREGDYQIPEGTEEIKNGAFYTAMNIGRVTVPDTVTKIGQYSFALPNADKIPKKLIIVASESSAAHKNALINGIPFEKKEVSVSDDEVKIPKGTIIKDKGLTYKATSNNTLYLTSIDDSLIDVVVPDEVEYEGHKFPVVQINTNVLSETSKAESIVIGNNVTKIMDVAFLGCDTLKRVHLGESVLECDYSAFNNCSGLETITVAEKNNNFKSDNGVLYKVDGENVILIRYPSSRDGEKYNVLEGTIELSQNSFERAKKLSELQIPNTVVKIGDEDTFYRPKSYKMLTIIGSPDSFIKTYYDKNFSDKNNISFREKD